MQNFTNAKRKTLLKFNGIYKYKNIIIMTHIRKFNEMTNQHDGIFSNAVGRELTTLNDAIEKAISCISHIKREFKTYHMEEYDMPNGVVTTEMLNDWYDKLVEIQNANQ